MAEKAPERTAPRRRLQPQSELVKPMRSCPSLQNAKTPSTIIRREPQARNHCGPHPKRPKAASRRVAARTGVFTSSGVVGTAVDRQHLAGHEIAVAGGEKDQRAEQIFRIFVALDGAALDGGGTGPFDMYVIGQAGVDQRIAGRQTSEGEASRE